MLFVTILVDLTLARANLDTQEMAQIALVSYICITRTPKLSVENNNNSNNNAK